MVDVPSWEFTCSCGTKEIDTSRSSTEKNAIGMFRAHREIWSDFAQTERQQINAGISRNADQLKELNSLSSGLLSLNQSVSKLGRMKK